MSWDAEKNLEGHPVDHIYAWFTTIEGMTIISYIKVIWHELDDWWKVK